MMEGHTMMPDSTVRSQDSSDSKESNNSKDTAISKDSRPDSCLESKHSKDQLITSEKHQPHHHRQPHHHSSSSSRRHQQQSHHPQQQHLHHQQNDSLDNSKDDTNILMFTSCGQLLLGIVLVVFGIMVLVHGASLGSSGAGLWAGAGSLIAGALGVVAALATSVNNSNSNSSSSSNKTSGFATAHLAFSLVTLALSNMSAITALTAVIRDSQKPPELTLLTIPGEEGTVIEVEGGWAGLLASIGLLVASIAELLVSGYICFTLTPKICGCLRTGSDDLVDGNKTRNMVHQWVVAQNVNAPGVSGGGGGNNKGQPIYLMQPMVPVHPMIPPPYGMPAPGKYPGFIPAGTLPMPAPGYAPLPVHPHLAYGPRPVSQMMRPRQKQRFIAIDHQQETMDRSRRRGIQSTSSESLKRDSSSGGEDQVDLAQTYTGLDKKMSEEFISIAMDPDRKSKASSSLSSDLGSCPKSSKL